MFLKFSIATLLIGSMILYLKYTEPFYLICKHIYEDESKKSMASEKNITHNFQDQLFFINDGNDGGCDSLSSHHDTKLESLTQICMDFYTDYTTHTIMKFTINKLNSVLYSTKSDVVDNEYIDSITSKIEMNNLKYILHSIKFIHLFAYSSLLYVIIISLPNIIANMLLYLLNRALAVIFAVLLIEAVLKMYLAVDTDVIAALDNDMYSKYFDNFLIKKFVEFAIFLFSLLKQLI